MPTKKGADSADRVEDASSDEEGDAGSPVRGGAAAFGLLAVDDDSGDEAPPSDDEPATAAAAVAAAAPTAPSKAAAKKAQKGQKKAKAAIDDDIDSILAALEKPVEKRAAKQTEAGDQADGAVDEEAVGDGDADDGKAKTAAQKRKEKKRKQELRKKEGAKDDSAPPDDADAEQSGAPAHADQPPDDDTAKTAKKAKKKKADAADGKPKRKAHVDLIKEALRRRQEEEEELLRREAAEVERLEAIAREKEEKAEKERERKERDKEKKKERIARLKKEGKYMTASQKQDRQRQLDSLELLKQQGTLVLPSSDGAKPFRYGDRKRQKKAVVGGDADVPTPTEEEERSVAESESPAEVAADSWDAADAVVDDWEKIDEAEAAPSAAPEPPAADADARSDVADNESADEQESSAESSSTSGESEAEEEEEGRVGAETKEQIRDRVKERLRKRHAEAEAKRSETDLRSPIVCVLGHVDHGKTKLLDKIRRTNVQDGEAGGITQQIGATMIPADTVRRQGAMVKDFDGADLRLPGLLVIDTPGHESFSNLRARGSSLCDIAILVVNIMEGLKQQTIESIKLLTKRRTPFVIALNMIDRIYEWKSCASKDIRNVLKSQQRNCQLEFADLVKEIVVQFAEQSINVALFWENTDPSEYISIVPTSAHTGDGIGNLMICLARHAQTYLASKLAFSEELQCSVLEVKALPGLGTTVDVILVNGWLRVGDVLVLSAADGAVVTQVRELLMPQPLKEMRVKNPYEHYKEVRAAQGIKLLAKNLEKTLAGLPLLVARREDEVDVLRADADENLKQALHAVKLSSVGVYVQASTLGSLEALLEFLRSQKIQYCGINIGPVHKRDVMKASTMLEQDAQWAAILAFDVKVERDAQQMADEMGVRIFQADIIYHLEDAFLKYREELRLRKRRENEHLAIFPCKLRVLPQHVFNARNPIVCGVSVETGLLKLGTPLVVPSKEMLFVGSVSSIEQNHKPVDLVRPGQEVCIKIENTTGEAPKLYGRHFTHEDLLCSRISRETIDACKTYFREDLTKADWQLIVELKKLLGIM